MNDAVPQFRKRSGRVLLNSDEVPYKELPIAMQQVRYDALVLDAKLRQSLVTVRSLGSRGMHVAALETSGNVPTFSSRWCQQGFFAPSYVEDKEPYLAYLLQLLDNAGARVLIASSEATVGLIRQHREQFEHRTCVALAQEPALGIALNKQRTLEIARRLGLGIPRSVIVETIDEVQAALHEVGLPAVVKPVESWAWGERIVGLGCKLATTPDEARHAAEEFIRVGMPMLFQQFLSGRREAMSFIYSGGRFYARFAQWAKRTQPPLGGTSVLRQSIAIPLDIGEQAELLIHEIRLEGYSEVEFRRDSKGYPYLMEINPRLSASVEVAVHAGIDFPYLLYRWANGDQLDEVKSYHVGNWMRYLGGDFMTTLTALQEHGRPEVPQPARALFDFCVSFFIPARYDYFDWRDPLPAWKSTLDFARYIMMLVRRLPAKLLSKIRPVRI